MNTKSTSTPSLPGNTQDTRLIYTPLFTDKSSCAASTCNFQEAAALLESFIASDKPSRSFLREFCVVGGRPVMFECSASAQGESASLAISPSLELSLSLEVSGLLLHNTQSNLFVLHSSLASPNFFTQALGYLQEQSNALNASQQLTMAVFCSEEQRTELKSRLSLKDFCHTNNYSYLQKEAPGFACADRLTELGLSIKTLDLSYLHLLLEHYKHVNDAAYLSARLESGCVLGLFAEGIPAGFIGEHDEGTMGMLEIFPPFRRRGYALILEGAKISQLMAEGRTPCDMVITNNEASHRLQHKLGCTLGKESCWWIGRIDHSADSSNN